MSRRPVRVPSEDEQRHTGLTVLGHRESRSLLETGEVDRLARQQGRLYFSSAAWIDAWLQCFESSATLLAVVHGDPARPEAALVGARLRRRVQHRLGLSLPYVGLAGAGRGAADLVGPLSASLPRAVDMVATLCSVRPSRPVSLEGVPIDLANDLVEQLDATIVSVRACLGVDPRTPAISTKTRKNLRRRTRLMEDEGITLRWVHDSEELLDGLATLRRLHLARWKSKGQEGLFADDRMRFLAHLAQSVDGEDGMWIALLEHRGDAIGALVGFQFGSTFCSYKTGWTPEYARFGPGLMMHASAIDRAAALGLRRYEFLRGTESHKATLGGVEQAIASVVVPNGVRGRILAVRDRLQAARDQ